MNLVGKLTSLVSKKPKSPKTARPFKAVKFDVWYRPRYWLSVSWQFKHVIITLYMGVMDALMLISLIVWHVGLAKTVADSFAFSYIMMYELTIIIWIAAFGVVVLTFISSAQNRRALADWLGFLPDRTRKRVLPTTKATKMLAIMRWTCYAAFSWQVVTILWWWSIFPNMPDEWHHLEPWRWRPLGPLLKQFWLWVSGFLVVTLMGERVWFVRRTRVALLMALFGATFLTLYLLWWATNNIDLWIDFRRWFGS